VLVSRAEERSSEETETKKARRDEVSAAQAATSGSHRIFVGGLVNEITSQHLQDEFSQFGEIKDIYIPKDVRTQAPRGFCYITFAEKESVDRAVENPPREINGHAIGEVKDSDSESKIYPYLQSPSKELQLHALVALAKLGNMEILPQVLKILFCWIRFIIKGLFKNQFGLVLKTNNINF
jgi:RNA recognition motif-containing protein